MGNGTASKTRVMLGAGALGLAACGATDRGQELLTSDGDPMVSTTTGSGAGDSTTTATTMPADAMGTTEAMDLGSGEDLPQLPKTDVLFVPDMPIAEEEGCQAIDFLFVIDNSGSMSSSQENLVDNFPAFSERIQATLEHVTSYHVGVVSTDAYTSSTAPCGDMGDLVTSTVSGGTNASQMACGPFAEGYNFMTQEDDLAASFACTAQLGTSNPGDEYPMDAVLAAIAPENQEPGECNEDFIRDDALLVIVIITDEADGPGDPDSQHSSGDPQSWYEGVVEAKGGIAQNIVVMSLINYYAEPEEDPYPSPCEPSGTTADGVNIKTFTQMFEENGHVAGICLDDYGPTFDAAIGVIDTACENFVPPG